MHIWFLIPRIIIKSLWSIKEDFKDWYILSAAECDVIFSLEPDLIIVSAATIKITRHCENHPPLRKSPFAANNGCYHKNLESRDERPTFVLFLHYVQHCITCNIALHATLHYVQHCLTCNIVLRPTLHYVQHCNTCNIVLCATLPYMQHCITCNIALSATLHYCNIVLHAPLHYMQCFITCNFATLQVRFPLSSS